MAVADLAISCVRIASAGIAGDSWIRLALETAAALAAALGNWIADCGCLVAAVLGAGGHVPWSGTAGRVRRRPGR